MMNTAAREETAFGECPDEDDCPNVRVRFLSGNATDCDCRDRIAAYSRPGISVSLFVCLSVWLFICLFCVMVCLSAVYLSVYLFVCSVCLSSAEIQRTVIAKTESLPFRPGISVIQFYMPVCLFVTLFVCLSVCSVYLSVSLSVVCPLSMSVCCLFSAETQRIVIAETESLPILGLVYL